MSPRPAAQRFPPPGMRVVRDTVVLRGAAAAARGALLRWLAVVLVVCMLAVSIAVWRLLAVLG